MLKFGETLHIFLVLLFLLTVAGCGSDSGGNSTIASNVDNNLNSTVTLKWTAPTTNADGSNLEDLGGYKMYYGTSTNNYTELIDVGNFVTIRIEEIPSLTPDTKYFFAVTAYDLSGNESNYSNEANFTIPLKPYN